MTTLLDKVLVGVIALLMAVGTGEFFLYRRADKTAQEALTQLGATKTLLSAEQARTQALTQSNAALSAAADTKQAELDKLRQKQAAVEKELNDALKANSAWAGTAVPDAVWDSLFPAAAGSNADRGAEVPTAR